MTVYEMIQELAQYKPDTEIKFHVKAEFDADVEAEFDRNNENDKQSVTAAAEFDEEVDYDYIHNYENIRYGIPSIQINLKY